MANRGRWMALVAVTALLLTGGRADAQAAGDDPRPSGCYRFTFGPWSPPLDWLRAGHDTSTLHQVRAARPSGSTHGSAPVGPPESASWDSTAAQQVLVLLPSWWPAGVTVRFPGFAAGRDSVSGVAQAFVADGRVELPTSRVIIWRFPCGR